MNRDLKMVNWKGGDIALNSLSHLPSPDLNELVEFYLNGVAGLKAAINEKHVD